MNQTEGDFCIVGADELAPTLTAEGFNGQDIAPLRARRIQ